MFEMFNPFIFFSGNKLLFNVHRFYSRKKIGLGGVTYM